MSLTDVQIRTSKPAAKPFKISDSGGLYILVNPSGSRLWRMDYRRLGKRKTLAIGAYPALSLTSARKKRDEAREQLAEGRDPVQQKLEVASAAQARAKNTFKLIANEWLAKLEAEGAATQTMKKKRWLIDFALPTLGHLPIEEIKAADENGRASVLAVLRKVEASGNFETAHRLRSTIGQVFRYAIATGRRQTDPTPGLKGALAAHTETHHATIFDPQKFGGLLRAVDEYDGNRVVQYAMKIAPHVFLRPGELRLGTWVELEQFGSNPIWRVPAARMKMKRDHVVPLSKQVASLLDELHELTGDGKLMFPGVRSTARPISENTLNAALRRMGYSKHEQTVHGFRRTASTMLNEARRNGKRRFESDWIERQLAHLEQNKVRAAYNAAEWLDDRKSMMQWWSNHLDDLRETSALLG